MRRDRSDGLSNLIEVWAGPSTDTVSTQCNFAEATLKLQQASSWDDFGNELSRSDALGRSWQYRYDYYGNLESSQTPEQAQAGSHCLCPAGKRLYRNGGECTINGYAATKYTSAARDCMPCEQRSRCLRTPEKTKVRQVAFFRGKRGHTESHTDRMKRRIDSSEGKRMIAARFATVEPVFGNLRHNKWLARFTLRGREKVDGQWKLYCLVHNIEKLGHQGYAN